MKKTLAIILSALMLFCALPFAGFAADEEVYDRYAVSSGDEAYIADMSAEQTAAVILDWVDREIAKATADFESFEIEAMGTTIAVDIPEIASLDDVITYKDYLAELGGDFANLDTTNLQPRGEGTYLDFIYGVLRFMADNSEIFGKVFRWDDQVFDYGKVGEYILGLDTTVEENKKIYDFYNDYLIGNDIQDKFIAEIAREMNYTIPTDENGERAETFDETISNAIINWFAGLCETNGILSAEGIETLKGYDLRTNDIYTLVKNFVGLVQSDNQVKIDTYYNYILDTVVRTLLKTTLGQSAQVGAEAELPAGFEATYTDLALLEEISGGTAYYQDADGAYYQVTIAGGAVTACNSLTWSDALDINFEAPRVEILTGANAGTKVAEYRPTSEDYKQFIYSTYAEQIAAEGFEVAGTTVADEYAALMVDANKGPAMSECFGVKVSQGETVISDVVIGFDEIEEYVNGIALQKANEAAALMVDGTTITACSVKSIDVAMAYDAWATADEFIVQVTATANATVNVTAVAPVIGEITTEQSLDASGYITNPVAVIVLDDLSGNLNIDDAKALLDFIDTDFVIDAGIVDFISNYDAYNGVVGQVNHILYDVVDMLVSDEAMDQLGLVDGNNDNFTANLQKICDTANEMMTAAEEVMNDEGLQEMLAGVGIDLSAILGELDLDLLYAIDFSSVEALYVSAISMGLDIFDDGSDETVAEIHAALDGLTNLDAMAVAATDYILAKCIPTVNESLGCALTVPAETDAAAVADGEGKDIVMTKLVDLALEAITWAVDDLLNGIINDFIATINGEAGTDLPEADFAFGVTKGADWETTLAAIVNRIYALADGIIIACDNDYTDTFDKISAVANAMLPLGSLASNCASENFAFDVNKVSGYIFDDGFDGDLDGFLRLFETKEKTADVAYDCSVTEALINASQHIVDSIFPGTVVAENYVNLENYDSASFTEETVKEYFTSAENDAVIASNNMDSIYARREALVPAALRLVRESGMLPYFAACDHDGETIPVEEVAATCSKTGLTAGTICADCGYIISGCEEIAVDKKAHGTNTETIPAVSNSCTAAGKTAGVKCLDCGTVISGCEVVPSAGHKYTSTVVAPTCTNQGYTTHTCTVCTESYADSIVSATGHTDADSNYACDTCGAELDKPQEETGFFAKIKAFFQRIIDWFKNLFK